MRICTKTTRKTLHTFYTDNYHPNFTENCSKCILKFFALYPENYDTVYKEL